MSRPKHLVRALAIVVMAMVLGAELLPAKVFAEQRNTKGAADDPQAEYVVSDGPVITLRANAPPPPPGYGTYRHFGTYTSSTQPFPSFFQALQLNYTNLNPGHGAVLVDVRASADGEHWTEWEIDLAAGATATFDRAARFAQYRIKLLGNGTTVAVRDLTLTPVGELEFTKMDALPVAPTFKVHATRMGMVGGRTANGHIIKKRDHYVSLPSWRSLSKRGGDEYLVRITYNGRTSVAPVYDVGPWNERDDYWNEERQRFNDLPRGYPQDHAAYFDGYNKGVAEKGKVSFPTAIDVGDGVWWDDLGIRGDRAVVEVTFLWLGTDPMAAQPPAPPAEVPAPTAAPAPPAAEAPAPPAPAPTEVPVPTAAPTEVPAPTAVPTEVPAPTAVPPPPAPAEALVDNQGPAFKQLQAKVWYDGPKDCASGHAHWTYTTTNPKDSENVARWQPSLAAEALYDVYVYVPDCGLKAARTASARYLVQHRDGQAQVEVNQQANGGQWVSIGRYPFGAGDASFVELRDVTGDSMQALWYDSVKWVPVK